MSKIKSVMDAIDNKDYTTAEKEINASLHASAFENVEDFRNEVTSNISAEEAPVEGSDNG